LIKADIYALVHSCDNSDHDKNSCLFQHWSKEFQYSRSNAEPILHVIPIDSFGHLVLVIEDAASIVEQLLTADLKVGVVTPHAEYWTNKICHKMTAIKHYYCLEK